MVSHLVLLKISRDRFGKSFGTKSFVLAFVSCYVINNCYVGVEMLKISRDRFGESFGTKCSIHRDWFGKSFGTVAFTGIGLVLTTVMLVEMLKISRDRFGKSFGTVLAFVNCYVINTGIGLVSHLVL